MKNLLPNPETITQDIAESGYIRMPRRISDRMFSYNPQEQKLYQLYSLLIIQARHKAGVWEFKNRMYTCEAGELITSCRDIENRLQISSSHVDRLLDELEEQQLISRTPAYQGQRICVLHYDQLTRGWSGSEKPKKKQPAENPVSDAQQAYEKETFEENKLLFKK